MTKISLFVLEDCGNIPIPHPKPCQTILTIAVPIRWSFNYALYSLFHVLPHEARFFMMLFLPFGLGLWTQTMFVIQSRWPMTTRERAKARGFRFESNHGFTVKREKVARCGYGCLGSTSRWVSMGARCARAGRGNETKTNGFYVKWREIV